MSEVTIKEVQSTYLNFAFQCVAKTAQIKKKKGFMANGQTYNKGHSMYKDASLTKQVGKQKEDNKQDYTSCSPGVLTETKLSIPKHHTMKSPLNNSASTNRRVDHQGGEVR